MWTYLKEQSAYQKPGYRCKLGEVDSWVKRSIDFLPEWSLLRFKTEFLCIELDMINDSDLTKPMAVKRYRRRSR